MTKQEQIEDLKILIKFFEEKIERAEENEWIEYGFNAEEGQRDVETFKAALEALEGSQE